MQHVVPAGAESGLVQGVTHSASRFGAAIAPPIVVLIMSQFGWRPVMILHLRRDRPAVVAGGWALTYRNLPEEHALVNKAELEAIRGIRRQRRHQSAADAKADAGAVAHAAALTEYVGDHVRLFHLRLLLWIF